MSCISVELGDITKLKVDAIVNAANKTLLGGGGVDGAIHRAAGGELLEECRGLHGCMTGEAKITKGYKLPSKFIIHTVGPIYSKDKDVSCLLANCYRNSLDLAKKNELHSIAFPSISTGAFGYPLDEAVPIAKRTVSDWLNAHSDYDIKVIFCCFDQETSNMYLGI